MYILLLFALALLAFYVYRQQNERIRLINKIPGPKGLPIIGNLLLGLTPVEKLWDVLVKFNKLYYPYVKVWIGSYALISIADPDDIELLLSSNKYIEKGFAYNQLRPWLKTGLLTSYGEKWRHRRKILTSAFHFNILKKYVDITNENGEKFIQALKSRGKETTQHLVSLCSKYTLNIISESAMGVSLAKIDTIRAENYKNAVYTMGNIVIYRITRPYITDLIMYLMYKLKKLQDKTLKTLHDFTNTVISERREYHKSADYKYLQEIENEDENCESTVYSGRKKRLAMLDLLLSAEMEKLIDEDGIREEVDTFMFEGHDTTGMAMTYTLMLLAENTDIQERARAEVKEVLDNSNGKIGMTEIQQLVYLERCIKESLRLYPPVSIISRYLAEDLQCKHYRIPAKTEVFCQIYLTHRDPKHWPEPEKFDPDRFLPEKIHGRHPYSYIPFSAGPRNCIGQKFAILELKALVSRILYHFKLEPIDRISDLKLLLDIVIRPAHPVRVKFVRIDE